MLQVNGEETMSTAQVFVCVMRLSRRENERQQTLKYFTL